MFTSSFSASIRFALPFWCISKTLSSVSIISLTVYPEGTIKSSGSIFNYIDNAKIQSVENATSKYLEKLLDDYLYSISKKYNSDIIGFKGICQSKYLTKDEFETIHWDEIFQDSFFDIKIKTKINSSNLFNKE